MALYEYLCRACGTRSERRMPMSDVLQRIKCPQCGKQAEKLIGNFAIIGGAGPAATDGPAPWESDGDGDGADDDGLGGHGHDFDAGHGHSHGPGGHTH
jgi:putative FmdB family regulatory protein